MSTKKTMFVETTLIAEGHEKNCHTNKKRLFPEVGLTFQKHWMDQKIQKDFGGTPLPVTDQES
jgi:hypothetical protein